MSNLVKNWKTKAGLEAWIWFVHHSHHCGYVEVPKKIEGRHYDDYDVDVHGGLTYGEKAPWSNDKYIVGYDCAHAGDACFGHCDEDEVWRNEDFCIEQCESLAAQLKALGETK